MKKKGLLLLILLASLSLSAQVDWTQYNSGTKIDGEDGTFAYDLRENKTNPNDRVAILYTVYSIDNNISGNAAITTADLQLPTSVTHNGKTYQVIAIGKQAFRNANITGALYIPEGIREIQASAFEKCRKLDGISFPKSLEIIRTGSFRDLYGGGTLEFRGAKTDESHLRTIEKEAFRNPGTPTNSFEGELYLPNSLTSIGDMAFKQAFLGKSGFGALHLPENISFLGKEAFHTCNGLNEELIVPGSLDTIRINAFKHCNFSNIIIEEGVRHLQNGSFQCVGQKNKIGGIYTVTIPSTCRSIGDAVNSEEARQAFYSTKILYAVDLYCPTPPVIPGNQFSWNEVILKTPFYIPCYSEEKYRSDELWNAVKTYKEITDQDLEPEKHVIVESFPEAGIAQYEVTHDCTTRSHTITITGSTQPKYRFSHWEDGSTANPRKVTAPNGTVYTACFIEDATVTDCGKDYILIETLQPLANASYSFAGGTGTNLTEIDKGIYRINTSDLTSHAGELLTLNLTNVHGQQIDDSWEIPVIITGSQNTSALTAIQAGRNLVVTTGATLTIDNATNLKNLYIQEGASCHVNNTLNAKEMYMRAKYNESTADMDFPQVSVNAQLVVANGTIYYDYVINRERQYPLVLPIDVDLNTQIHHANGDEVAIGMLRYNTDTRATGASGWEQLTGATLSNFTTLRHGTGYRIWATPRKWNGVSQRYATVRFSLSTGKRTGDAASTQRTIPVYASDKQDGSIVDRNWNMLGNPFMTTVLGQGSSMLHGQLMQDELTGEWAWVENEQRYIMFSQDDGTTYEWAEAAGYNLPVGGWFFAQVQETGYIGMNRPTATRSLMASSMTDEDTPAEYTAALLLQHNLQTDRIGLLIADSYTDNYEINADLGKMFSGKEHMSFYLLHGTTPLCVNATCPATAEKGLPIGLRTANLTGEFTVKLDTNYDLSAFSAICLTDNKTNETVNLLWNDYTFTTDKKEDNTRFSVQAILRTDKPTALDDTDMLRCTATSSDSQLLISRLPEHANVWVYDAAGRMVGAYAGCAPTLRCTVPAKGVYMIRIQAGDNSCLLRTIVK